MFLDVLPFKKTIRPAFVRVYGDEPCITLPEGSAPPPEGAR